MSLEIGSENNFFSDQCDLCKAARNVVLAVEQLDTEHSLDEAVRLIEVEKIASAWAVPLPLLKRRLGLSPRRTNWTPELIDRLRADVDAGLTVPELSAKWHLSKSRVAQVIDEQKIDTAPGKRARAKAEAKRRMFVHAAVMQIYELDDRSQELSPEAMHAWIAKAHPDFEISLEEVLAAVKQLGLVTGELDALPPTKTGKKVPSQVSRETPVTDVALPGDVVEVRKKPADWLAEFYAETPDGTQQQYSDWAKDTDAPGVTDLRNEYGNWGNAMSIAKSKSTEQG